MRQLVILFTLCGLVVIPLQAQHVLTFKERVEAQRAIERVYYDHRIWPMENPGPKPPFEVAISDKLLRSKVEDYLLKSAALDHYWRRPLSGEQLQAELNRIVGNSRASDVLQELFQALNNDPHLIAECLIRPALSDRLIRNWYAYDGEIHGSIRDRARQIADTYMAEKVVPEEGIYCEVLLVASEDAIDTDPGDRWQLVNVEIFRYVSSLFPDSPESVNLDENPDSFVCYITYEKSDKEIHGATITFIKQSFDHWFEEDVRENVLPAIKDEFFTYTLPQFSGTDGQRSLQSMPDSPDSWQELWFIPLARSSHTAVWTGTEMIIWGGVKGSNSFTNTGARYTPATDSWEPTSLTNAPDATYSHTAVWTGTEMIVWGNGSPKPGGAYNPQVDTWRDLSALDAPSPRIQHSAVWTGDRMIIWGGGVPGSQLDSGAQYNPLSDEWSPTTLTGAPDARRNHSGVWSGREMLVWGGLQGSNALSTGGRYDPILDEWTAIQTSGAPLERYGHSAVWSGQEMVIWGGTTSTNAGGRYNPISDSWRATNVVDAPSARSGQSAVWTGAEMIIWGSVISADGARYNPFEDTWESVPTAGAPEIRSNHSAVWTGSEMIVWGGLYSGSYLNTGGKYSPALDNWISTYAAAEVPQKRTGHTAIWTGSEMIVWGGSTTTVSYNTGGKYNPAMGLWTPTSTDGSPDGRTHHTAVWTGDRMIVWGGYLRVNFPDEPRTNTGGIYDPLMDSWQLTNDLTAPEKRFYHTAVWTGDHMIVWGGIGLSDRVNSGGLYDPDNDTWISTCDDTSLLCNVPAARSSHTSIWTGSEMIIWGGRDSTGYFQSGAKYFPPPLDIWGGTALVDAPTARNDHTAIWTGSEMIVWGGNAGAGVYPIDGGKYDPDANLWTSTSLTGAPAERSSHTAIWSGLDMIIWGGGLAVGAYDEGGIYFSNQDVWRPTPDQGAPKGRRGHSAIWTGEEMIIWDGSDFSQTGVILYPNTTPSALPLLNPAVYDPAILAPACMTPVGMCDSINLLESRDNITGQSELNQPNTIDACADGSMGTFHQDKSVDRISVRTLDGKVFSPGKTIKVEITIWADTTYADDRLDLYYNSDVTSDDWDLIDTLTPNAPGLNVLSTQFVLLPGTLQVVRASLRWAISSPDPCVGDPYADTDDLVFSLNETGDLYSIYTLGLTPSQELTLVSFDSTDGSNPTTRTPFHDKLDSITGYDWSFQHGLSTVCGVNLDRSGQNLILTESDLREVGVDAPGNYTIWHEIIDEKGSEDCSPLYLTVLDGQSPFVNVLTPNGGESWAYSDTISDR
ncbi:MAG TPA: hypothetical protein PK014_08050, partial [Thermoanaerobaculia bacterium]|nr:hypothetical protein [Thermoanaerobaculia bacterium]HUM30219.1 hypothetical protein [Thermoanaerobaculia bacterium]HXK68332.1 hypothetical protein [Thermoanaerobaculia bacterium]